MLTSHKLAIETKNDIFTCVYMCKLAKEVDRIFEEQEHKPKSRDYSMCDYKAAILADLREANKYKMTLTELRAYSLLASIYRSHGSWS